MSSPNLEERMDNLEKIVEPLRGLPDRVAAVELQIMQLRGEMRDGFSAIRNEMATLDDIAELGRDIAQKLLESEDKVGRKMTVLFEEHLGKRKSIDEGHPGV